MVAVSLLMAGRRKGAMMSLTRDLLSSAWGKRPFLPTSGDVSGSVFNGNFGEELPSEARTSRDDIRSPEVGPAGQGAIACAAAHAAAAHHRGR